MPPRRPTWFHALSGDQSVLDFVNTKLDENNYHTLLGLGVIRKKAMEVNFTLAGQRQISLGAAIQLQQCVRLALNRFLDEKDNPLRESLFRVAGRDPFGVVEEESDCNRKVQRPVKISVTEYGVSPAGNDLQDMLYLRVAGLFRQHKRFDGLPPEKVLLGWTDKVPPPGPPRKKGEGPSSFRVSFHPLSQCAAPGCRRFYFRKRKGDNTCGEKRCALALDYREHKDKRRPPGRPRNRITIPPPREKRHPA